MDLKRMGHVVALADARHFGRAAEQCHLSQPAFSRSILAAEDELGLLLFNRGTAEVTCTDAGAFVVERARKLLFDSRCLERDVSLYRERKIGDIAFGVGPYPAGTVLQSLLCDLRTHYAGIHIYVDVNKAPYLTEHLRNETLDFFIASLAFVPTDPDLVIAPLGKLYAEFYVRRDHPLCGQAVPLAALLPYGVATVDVAQPIQLELGRLAGLASGAGFPMAVTCDDVQVLKGVALATDTVAVCPVGGVAAEVQQGALVRLAVTDVEPMFAPIGVVSLRGRSFSAMAEYAIGVLGRLV